MRFTYYTSQAMLNVADFETHL